MGQDKAWVEFNRKPMIQAALQTLRLVGISEIYISGRADATYAGLGCPVLLDLKPGTGPMGGIERALDASVSSLVLVLAVDMPRMNASFLRRLIDTCSHSVGTVPVRGGFLEPLAAIYPKRCHSLAQDAIASSRLAVRHFAEACIRLRAVQALPVSGGDESCFANVNHPRDLAAISPGGGSTVDEAGSPLSSQELHSAAFSSMGVAVRVLFFAQLKDLAGCAECSLEAHGPLSVDALWAQLDARFPGIAARRPQVRLARNWEYAPVGTVFHDADEIALIPPVSGG